MTHLSRLGAMVERLMLYSSVEITESEAESALCDTKMIAKEEVVADTEGDDDDCDYVDIRFSGNVRIDDADDGHYLHEYHFEAVVGFEDEKIIGRASVVVFRTDEAIQKGERPIFVFDAAQDHNDLFAVLFRTKGGAMRSPRIPRLFDERLCCINRSNKDVVYVSTIEVEPRYRRRGVGSKILTAIKQVFERYGLFCSTVYGHDDLSLWTGFFKKNGFELRAKGYVFGGHISLFLYDEK